MKKFRILWADDEIDLLKPHILFFVDSLGSEPDRSRPFSLAFQKKTSPLLNGTCWIVDDFSWHCFEILLRYTREYEPAGRKRRTYDRQALL